MVSTSVLCTPPGDILPVPRDAISGDEVADMTKLPFTSASDEEIIGDAMALFKQIISGALIEECDTFLTANDIALSQ